ncbi:MAG: aminoacyl-tRNA hydrolase [Bdellovibrionales bacterium RIFCSPHIGHO2_01_FULL_40_29]|nr:MAG: aminoacyl-tRNA hydrolase [Bdellovibrionales bacterium RIFCSPHIGHO2_01_FULL_40_29]OFZ33810.1 MAG: aminoacyl-tRNA hydrolase [Bdellovibrionales bacterium RIFCSPHIGHO2_02_FULL_40_15]
MWLIVGLGNPGKQYQMTRHNIGFMCVDYWLKSLSGNTPDYRDEHKALTKKFKLEGEEILVAKPQTYMNKSGEAVQSLMSFYKIPREKMLIIHDDIDQGFGSLRFHKNRGHGGQNGVRNITELLGSMEYSRLKIGIGRPTHPDFDIGDYVLSGFSKEETLLLPKIFEKACNGIECFISKGFDRACTDFNGNAL